MAEKLVLELLYEQVSLFIRGRLRQVILVQLNGHYFLSYFVEERKIRNGLLIGKHVAIKFLFS